MLRSMLFMLLTSVSLSASADATRTDRLVADAKAVVAEMAGGDFDKVTARFDAKMHAALSADRLRATWASVEQQAGKFRRASAATSSEHDGFLVVVVTCEFANAAIDAKVAYDADDKMAGLFLTPHAASPSAYVAPDYVNRAAFSERETKVGNGNLSLPATLAVPNGKGPFPGVVLVHGSGPQDRDQTIGPNRVFRDIAWGLASRGVAVLRYEKRTHEHPDAFASGKFTIDDETVDDAIAAAALLRTIEAIDASRIYVCGHSQGAMMAPRMGQRDPRLAGLVLLAAPARPLEDIVVDQQEYLASLGGEDPGETETMLAEIRHKRDEIKHLDATKPATGPLLLNLPETYWLDLRGYDPVAVAKTLHTPILVIQGARDFQVTAPDFARWTDACKAEPRIQCKSFPSLNHLLIAGSGRSTPAEYNTALHVSADVIAAIALWIEAGKPLA